MLGIAGLTAEQAFKQLDLHERVFKTFSQSSLHLNYKLGQYLTYVP